MEAASKRRWLSIASVVVVIGFWQLSSLVVPTLILPSPIAVLSNFADPAWLLQVVQALGHSLIQLVLGFSLALAIAIPLGILIGRSSILQELFMPVLGAFYAIPPVAFVPFIVIWFGLFLEARVALVFWMCFFDIIVLIIAGARDVRKELLNVGRSFGLSRPQQFRRVLLPALLPFIVGSLRVGSARAINGMITAELFLGAVNLGRMLKRSSQQYDTAAVLAIVLVVCFLGAASQALIARAEKRFLHWHGAR